jgi:RNA polymerase sigma-70 factor (ECF subfamily)
MSTIRPDLPARDDAALAAALVAKERGAAVEAWSRFSPMVLGLLRRFFGPGADRQDLCQEVFMRFFARIGELRDPSRLRAFLMGICLGVAQNEQRRVQVRRWVRLTPAGELPDFAVTGLDPEAQEAMARFYQILARVSVEDRSLFVTRYVEKMEIAEVAETLGIPLSTAKRRLVRATRRIAAKMNREPALARYVDNLLARRSVKT